MRPANSDYHLPAASMYTQDSVFSHVSALSVGLDRPVGERANHVGRAANIRGA